MRDGEYQWMLSSDSDSSVEHCASDLFCAKTRTPPLDDALFSVLFSIGAANFGRDPVTFKIVVPKS